MSRAPTRRWLWLSLPGLLWGFTAFVHPTLPPPAAVSGTASRPAPPAHAPSPLLELTPARLLYVWDADVVGDEARTVELLDFCEQHRIQQLAVEASPLGYDEPGARPRYREFVARAAERGLQVFALGGCAWWTLAADRGAPGQNTCDTEGFGFYSVIGTSGVPFAGVLDDSEPHSTHNQWWFENLDVAIPDYLNFLDQVRERLRPMPFIVTVPFWFDEDPRLLWVGEWGSSGAHSSPAGRLTDPDASPGSGSGIANRPRSLLQAVQSRVDGIAVMDYRDRAKGEDGLIQHAQGELHGGPTWIGVETDDLGAKLDKVTFWEEGRRAMDQELAQVKAAFGDHANFRGFAIHHYDSYRRLRD